MSKVRKTIRRAARRYGVDPGILEAQLRAESGLNRNAVSPAGARGIAQFMPATAKQYGVNLHDGRIKDDIDGAARYMRDNLRKTGGNYHEALSIYNSGRPDAYKDPNFAKGQTYNYVKKILADAGGKHSSPTQQQGATYRTTTTTTPGVDNSEGRQQAKLAYLQGSHDPDALLNLGLSLRGLQDTPSSSTTKRVRIKGSGGLGAAQAGGFGGRVKINPGADRAGVRTHKGVLRFARQVSAIAGEPIRIGTGTNHSQMTVSGNVSDHWSGNAADIPARGKNLIRLGQSALIAAGMNPKKARKQRGGLYNVNGHQIIFNTHEGGDHTNHLHISAR